jgi:hypothetical protein
MSFAVIAAAAACRPRLVVPRLYAGNMCGVRVSGLPPIAGGPPDPSLVVSWIIFRYGPTDRERIYAAWRARGCVDALTSWPDARAAGLSIAEFVAHCSELVDAGFLPTVMLCSKDFDPADVTTILTGARAVLHALLDAGVVARVCIGWELSLWLSPTQVQQLIDAICAITVPAGIKTYVHFQQGYSTFGQPGETFAAFWNRNIGKLTGVLHQKVLTQTKAQYRGDSGGLCDVLLRFAGQFNVSPDSGFGHPFDLIALEITAAQQFDGSCSEADGDAFGCWACDTPAVNGPLGPVRVMGSGNGGGFS